MLLCHDETDRLRHVCNSIILMQKLCSLERCVKIYIVYYSGELKCSRLHEIFYLNSNIYKKMHKKLKNHKKMN